MVSFRNLTHIAILLFSSATVCAAPSRVNKSQTIRAELDVGVDITNVEVDDLVELLEDFDIDMLDALDDATGLTDVEIHARVQHLNGRFPGVVITGRNIMSDVTNANYVSRTRTILPHYAQTCTILASKSFFPRIQGDLLIMDACLNALTTNVSRLGGVSAASLAPEIVNDPSGMAKCYPKTASTIAGLSR